jgi:hypothetical protein
MQLQYLRELLSLQLDVHLEEGQQMRQLQVLRAHQRDEGSTPTLRRSFQLVRSQL